MSRFDPPQSYYDPPSEPEPCCLLAEDDPDHDTQACLAASWEAAAEARADAQRDRERDW